MTTAVMIKIQMSTEDKQGMEETSRQLGLSTDDAFTLFAQKVIQEKRIPFEISHDLFYFDSNMKYLETIMADVECGKAHFSEHDLTDS